MPAGTSGDAERVAIDRYIQEFDVEQAIQGMMQGLLEAKPSNPKQWLRNRLEQELSEESDELSKSDLHRLFAVTRKITSEIVPQETIDIVVSETLKLLNCDTVSLFVLDRKSGMLRLYASNLDTPIVVSPGQGIAGSVFNMKETVNIPDCYQDSRFDKSFDRKSGYITKSLLAVPIIDFDSSAVGVIQAINKLPTATESTPADGDSRPSGTRAVPFLRNDEKMLAPTGPVTNKFTRPGHFLECDHGDCSGMESDETDEQQLSSVHLSQYVGTALRNAEVYREAITTSDRAQGLLNTIQILSQDLGTQSMLLNITTHASQVVSSERCTVWLVDEQKHELWSVSTDTGQEIRIPKKAGIAGQCCCEGILINIPDAYADKRFNQEIDKKTGFKTQSILAIPMLGEDRDKQHGEMGHHGHHATHVIGVIQMINKVSYDGQLESFDESDVQVMEMFAKFVGPKLAHSSMVARMMARRKSETGDQKEGELAFGVMHLDNPHRKGGGDTGKRVGSLAMDTFGEDVLREEDEDEEDAA